MLSCTFLDGPSDSMISISVDSPSEVSQLFDLIDNNKFCDGLTPIETIPERFKSTKPSSLITAQETSLSPDSPNRI